MFNLSESKHGSLHIMIVYTMWLRLFAYKFSQNFDFPTDKFNSVFQLLQNIFRHAQITSFLKLNSGDSLENLVKIEKIVGAFVALLTILYRKENQKNESNVCSNRWHS